MIELENLTKRFGETTAVDGLTLRVAQGEIFGFLGPNGAGKTTTVRMLSCLISKTSGEARIDGFDVGKDGDKTSIRRTVGMLPENVGLYDDVSAYKNLDYYGRLYDIPEGQRKARIELLLSTVGLLEKKDAAVGAFSKGMRQKVAIARALIHDPSVIFLDEPTANLDPESSRRIRDLIVGLRREKKTVFVNTHNLGEADQICDRIGLMKTRLLAVGTPRELKESLGARRTAVRLERVDESMVSAAKKTGRSVEVRGDTLVFDVGDPDRDNPAIVDAMVAAGGRVRFVTDLSATLEDTYLKLVGAEGA
jgi:ABC-2 type transport system ATP-binding protein